MIGTVSHCQPSPPFVRMRFRFCHSCFLNCTVSRMMKVSAESSLSK